MSFAWVVDRFAKKFATRAMPFSELRGIGMVGLWRASERYRPDLDPSRNFEAWAALYIRGEIIDWIRTHVDCFQRPRQPRRAKRKGRERVSAARADRVASENEGIAQVDARDWCDTMIPRLRPRFHKYLNARLAGLTPLETAKALGLSHDSVSPELNEAFRQLRSFDE